MIFKTRPHGQQVHAGASGGLSSQDGVSHQEEETSLTIPKFNRFVETSMEEGPVCLL